MTQTTTARLLDPDVWQGKIYSGGWKTPGGGTAAVYDKGSGAVVGTTGIANAADMRAACKRAKAAGKKWAATPPAERAAILLRAADIMEAAGAEIAATEIRETGGVPMKGTIDVRVSVAEFRESAKLIERELRVVLEKTADYESVAVRIPLGVVGVITPWNMPMALATRSAGPALVLGNTVVLKPDLQTPISGGFFVAAALEAAGLPPDVFHVLPGDAEPGAALASDPDVKMISFTGSTEIGRLVGEAAGRTLKRSALELGGNSPFIVLDDADIELAATAGAYGSFQYQGQICMATSRHLVHEKIADAYVKRLTEKAAACAVGDPGAGEVQLGPLINDAQLARVTGIVDKTLAAGAKATTGATHEGRFFRPTVLTGVTPEMAAFSSEIFGPVAPITTFATDEEAIALANDTEYGLSSAIYSNDIARATRIAEQLETGKAHINDPTIIDTPFAPFGGLGASGNGSRFGGLTNLDEFTTWRWLTIRTTGLPHPPF